MRGCNVRVSQTHGNQPETRCLIRRNQINDVINDSKICDTILLHAELHPGNVISQQLSAGRCEQTDLIIVAVLHLQHRMGRSRTQPNAREIGIYDGEGR